MLILSPDVRIRLASKPLRSKNGCFDFDFGGLTQPWQCRIRLASKPLRSRSGCFDFDFRAWANPGRRGSCGFRSQSSHSRFEAASKSKWLLRLRFSSLVLHVRYNYTWHAHVRYNYTWHARGFEAASKREWLLRLRNPTPQFRLTSIAPIMSKNGLDILHLMLYNVVLSA